MAKKTAKPAAKATKPAAKPMTKAAMIDAIAKETGFTKVCIEEAYNAILALTAKETKKALADFTIPSEPSLTCKVVTVFKNIRTLNPPV